MGENVEQSKERKTGITRNATEMTELTSRRNRGMNGKKDVKHFSFFPLMLFSPVASAPRKLGYE